MTTPKPDDFYIEGMTQLAMTNDASILRDLPAHQLQLVANNRFTYYRLIEALRARPAEGKK